MQVEAEDGSKQLVVDAEEEEGDIFEGVLDKENRISELYKDAKIVEYQWEEVEGSAGVKQGGTTVTKNSYRVEIT